MNIKDLPKATTVDLNKGRLLYCEDGINIKQLPASLLANLEASNNNNNEEEESS